MESFFISALIIIICLVFIAVLSSSEAAFIAVNRIRLRNLIDKGSKRAKTVQKIRDRHDRLFSAVIFSGNLFTILATSIGTALALRIFDQDAGIIIATVVMTFLTVVFGELAPKTFAVSHAEGVSLALAKPIDLYIKLISPLVWIFNRSSNFVIKFFGGEVKPAPQLLTEEEMKSMIEIGEEEGTLEKEEKEMLHNVFEFGDTKVSEAMVPRTEIESIPEDAMVGDVLELVSTKGYSRYPVIKETVDNIIGILYVKDILLKMSKETVDSTTPIKNITRDAYYIPSSKMVTELLDDMQKNKFQIAIIVDEHGGTAGLITLEDIMEEIVGGLQDEFEAIEAEKEVEVVDESTFVVAGHTGIDEINELVGVEVSSEDFHTIGGFLFGLFGHLPKAGEQLRFHDLRFLILEMDGKKIEKIKITRL
ncbi:MAG TPA: HlyC/CorC family transporter [Nitrospirae bacterium]|nr:magnesium and cobalt efflux protein CorC [bacterium BMS3Abin10]GBE37588.1 magnesium and cobalt efflux protein CorC [bacterium BMS3Bbin08]HDH34383.1 HlyC/CorC family transporter [Nitrospirota bacterium]HDH50002.1 HlyC/CorC family transporter [Nitrospirota bacterium]HDK16366.1 HlyC/CorC family transporter [Nitrospirota bacterium]